MYDEKELLRRYFAWLKYRPSLVTGRVGESDVAHFTLPLRAVWPGRAPTVAWSGTGHTGVRGFFALPLEPELHRAEYKHSYHDLGQEAFLALHNIPLEHVASLIAANLAQFLLEEVL